MLQVTMRLAFGVWDAEAQANLPQWIKIWLGFIGLVFISGLLFVYKYNEARWLVAGVILGLLASTFVVSALGLVPLSGLVALLHLVFWSPALFFLLKNRSFMQGFSIYNVYAGLATVCILFSFIFDITDAAIYLFHIML